MKKTILALLASAMISGVYAQIDSVKTYAEVTIEEKRLTQIPFDRAPRNIQVIDRKEILAMPAQNLAEVLSYVAGVDLRQRGPLGGQADVSILGSTFEQVLVLLDGVPMRDAQTGHLMMNLPVDIQQIERIEIIKGTAARIYGSNALAGAINIVTRLPASEQIVAHVWGGIVAPLEGDSVQGYLQTGVRLGAGWKNDSGRQRHQVDAACFDSEGYRYNSANTQRRLAYRGKMILGSRKAQLDLAAGTLKNEVGANGFYAYPFDTDAFETTQTTFGSVQYQDQIGQWRIHPLVYMRYSHDDYIFIKEQPQIYRNNHYTSAAGAELHVSKVNGAGEFGGGYESRMEVIRSNNLGEHERYYHSFYGEQRLVFDNSAVAVIGAMAQYSSSYGLTVYPGIEFSTPLIKEFRLFGNLGLGSRNPSFTDLYYTDRANLGNPRLMPEEAINSELGLKWNSYFIQASSSGFLRRTSNFIDFTRSSDEDKWIPENFQLVTMVGLDTKIRLLLERKSKIAMENVVIGHTFLSGQLAVTPEFSKYALNNLRHQLVVQTQLRIHPMLRAQLISRYLERFNGASYWVLDTRVIGQLPSFDLSLDVTNMMDETYVENGFVPMPGRMFRLSVMWKLKGE